VAVECASGEPTTAKIVRSHSA